MTGELISYQVHYDPYTYFKDIWCSVVIHPKGVGSNPTTSEVDGCQLTRTLYLVNKCKSLYSLHSIAFKII